ncbi:response regulator [Halomonas sp. QX-2]|jgi:CheY-like chemotaxis protein|uniref:Response regulator n=2 Tax=Vreelandella TaxID=3137766 RepID=A0A7Z0N8V6_9GAMM|nr:MULTISPECIES: response regulator [Halomonas]NYT73563.1 response regulator [Halomonas sedimenti]QKS27121.1 hypothetical protein FX987_04942 [Halomonas titanicae]CDG51274.1 conserved hypothetical protein [Halomonas sp. A3H3]SDJ14460.1 hypothetical protein SAMN04487867_12539 [Halomonas titanicae]
MPKWKVLSVDDNSEMHEDLSRILSTRMDDDEFEFIFETSFSAGLKLIQESKFDFVFLDVHEDLSDPDPMDNLEEEDQRGEQLLVALKETIFVPVIFYTGYPSKVEHLKSHVVKVVEKGSPPQDIRDAVKSILETRLPHLTRYIEDKSRAYIWENLEKSLNETTTGKIESDIALLVARNLAKNLSQNSIKELLGCDTSRINPLEMYLFPPEKGGCNPADIICRKDDNTLWMVLTPACDFVQENAENVLLARVTPLTEHELYINWENELKMYHEIPEAQRGKSSKVPVNQARSKVKDIVNNKHKARYRFLAGTFFIDDCIVDFQNLLHMPMVEEDGYRPICSLDNPYREEFLQIFSNYYGRIGTPDYAKDEVWNKIDEKFIF